MNVISTSYGNDSLALIQLAHELALNDVVVTYIDTGWSGDGWPQRVNEGEAYAKSLGFEVVRIEADLKFRELMKLKKGFPNQRFQWCSGLLKGLPFLNWLDSRDPDATATVLIGKRRAEGEKGGDRLNTPEYVEASEYHGGRKLWHPLYLHTDEERDALIQRAGFKPLPHRSLECDPCVNANKGDFRRLAAADIAKVEALERDVGKTMFRPKRHGGATGIREVIKWARYSSAQYTPGQDDLFSAGCGSPFGCGL